MRSSDWSSDVCSSDLACVVGAMALFGGRPGSAAEFHCNACDVKASEVERCQRMDPADYVTGLLFNPSGMKTYFKRSSCLQAIAVDYRDASLCEDVRERKSRSEEHTSELQSLMRNSYAVFGLKKKT